MLTPIASRLSLATVMLALATTASAQDMRRVTGTVTDSSGAVIPYVNVDGGPRYRTLSNAAGEFALMLPKTASLDLAIRRIGFLAGKIRIEAGEDTTVGVTLQQLGVLMETQVIRAKAQVRNLATRGFYARMADREQGGLVADFVTPEEIEMRHPMRTTQLLEQRRGITVRRVGSCFVQSTCYRVLGNGGCAATIYLDGKRLNSLSAAAAAGPGSAPEIDDLIPVTSVSGIEVYPRASAAPPQYQALAGTCAIVVVWSR